MPHPRQRLCEFSVGRRLEALPMHAYWWEPETKQVPRNGLPRWHFQRFTLEQHEHRIQCGVLGVNKHLEQTRQRVVAKRQYWCR